MIDEFLFDIKKEMNTFICFISKNRWYFLISIIGLLIIYGSWLFNYNPQIDSEVMINSPYSAFNWKIIGRQGALLTKYVFNVIWYNPFFAPLLGFFLLSLSAIILSYLIDRFGNINNIFTLLLPILLFSNPIMVEQFYFDLQILEIGWGFILCMIAVWIVFVNNNIKNVYFNILLCICLIWSISTYQSFVVVYITIVVFLFILFYRNCMIINNQTEFSCLIRIILYSIIALTITLILNNIISQLWFWDGGEYLTSKINWKNVSIYESLKNIYTHLKKAFFGETVFYTGFFAFFAIFALFMSIKEIFKEKKKMKWIYILALLGLQLCPFLMTFYFGKEPDTRSQLAYPLVLVIDMLLCNIHVSRNRIFKILISSSIVICMWNQIQTTERLIYTDEIRAQEDYRVMVEIYDDIQEISSTIKPIAFVGTRNNILNNACIRGEIIGVSIFNINSDALPHYWHTSDRINNLFRTLGFPLQNVNENQFLKARKKAVNMPIWPSEGSIYDEGEYIIVKLSEDNWQEDFIDLELKDLE